MIIREEYLAKIRPFYDQDLIKVLTGMRRCGKSVLLKQIINELENKGISEEQIIYINFEFMEYNHIQNEVDLNEYINSLIKTTSKYYLFFDEIQNVRNWEKTINSLKAKGDHSIFITGSNSDLLSGELASHIAGRYVSFRIFPFNFKEVCQIQAGVNTDKDTLFYDYITWGGLPQRFSMIDAEQVRTYLSDIYDSIVVKDIINRFEIKDLDLLNRIIEYIMTTPSQTFSADNLVNYFSAHDERKTSKNTLYNYLEYMTKAMLINKVDRYDVRGKRILTGKYKYYLTDLGIGQVLNTSKRPQLGAYLENVILNELLVRGYTVHIGNIEKGEIDFIATKFDEKMYIQVAYLLADEKVVNREFGTFNGVNDNYPKYVLSMDKFDFSRDGIIHKNAIEWLLDK